MPLAIGHPAYWNHSWYVTLRHSASTPSNGNPAFFKGLTSNGNSSNTSKNTGVITPSLGGAPRTTLL